MPTMISFCEMLRLKKYLLLRLKFLFVVVAGAVVVADAEAVAAGSVGAALGVWWTVLVTMIGTRTKCGVTGACCLGTTCIVGLGACGLVLALA